MSSSTSTTAPNIADDAEITGKDQLIAYMAAGCKPAADWRIGTEHEKFAFDPETLKPLAYEGERGIRAVLDGLQRFGWKPVLENGKPIALLKPDMSSVTLEPGGQIELSGAPLKTIHETCHETTEHLTQVKEVAADLNVAFLGLGHRPKARLDEVSWMPKSRYAIMRDYMPKKGALGLEMMLATCTVQVNLDFASEAAMVEMFRIALALQPVATALWANSPFKEGAKTGYLSYRSHIWTDTDGDRCGMLSFVFDDDFGFERYVDYILDMPMYFVYRDGVYIDASGQSFRDFMAAKLPALPGKVPLIKDWIDHLTTAFPEVRLKQFIEMRGADGGPWSRLCALPAFWVGLLYDEKSRAAAAQMIADWRIEEIENMRLEVPKLALKTPFRGATVGDVALEVLDLAHDGLARRGQLDSMSQDESHYLNPLFRIAESGITPAEELLHAFDGRWKGNVDPVFREYAY